MVIKFDSETLRLMNYFKNVTGVLCKDCFEFNNTVVFITEANQTGLAIGKAGKNKQILEKNLHKNVKIVGYANKPEELVKNFLLPMQSSVTLSNENHQGLVLNIKFNFTRERRVLLSKNLENLKLLKATVARYFPNVLNIIVLQ